MRIKIKLRRVCRFQITFYCDWAEFTLCICLCCWCLSRTLLLNSIYLMRVTGGAGSACDVERGDICVEYIFAAFDGFA